MVKRVVWFYLVVFTGFMSIFLSCEHSKPIARVANYVIRLQELEEDLAGSRAPANTMSDVLSHVDKLVDNKLKLIDAYKSGYEQDSLVLSRLQDFESRQVFSYLIEHEVIRKIVTNKMIKERYEQNSKEWHVRHIFFPAGRDSLQMIKTLNVLRAKILRGEDFGLLARKNSEDNKSAGKNGDLGFIRWDTKTWGEPFMQVVSTLDVGEVSKVILSDKGFHLVKLENIRQVDQQSFSKEKEKTERQLIRENTSLLDSTYFAYRDKMQKKYETEISQDMVDSVLTLIKKTEEQNLADKVNLRRDPDHFRSFLSLPERQISLATFSGGAYTFENLLDTYVTISPMRRPALENNAAVLEFLNRNVPRKVITHHGYKKWVHRRAAVKKAVLQEKERLMIRQIQRVKIDQNVEIPEQELLDYYNNNKHLYEENISVDVQEIQVSDSAKANNIYQQALAGENFEVLARTFNERKETIDNAGKLGFISRRDYGNIGRRAVRLKTGEISEPIKNKNRYSIIKILDRRSGELRPFEDVRQRIRREKRLERRNQLLNDYLDSLRRTYPVFVYRDVIKKELDISDE